MKATYIGKKPIIVAFIALAFLCALMIFALPSSATETGFSYDLTEEGIYISSYYGTDKNITIPLTLDGADVVGIRPYCFMNNTTIERVTLQSNIKEIPKNAFLYASNLKYVFMPDTLTKINDEAFFGCSSLLSLDIPDSVNTIGESAFYWCQSLQRIHLPDSLNVIAKKCFEGCKSLDMIEIPTGLTQISEKAFMNCTSLKSIDIPDSVGTIELYAFWNCSSLESVKLPKASLTSIPVSCFENCSSLKSVEIPGCVKTVYSSAFASNTSLKTVIINPGCEDIEYSVFNGDLALEKVFIPSSVTVLRSSALPQRASLTIYSADGTRGASYASTYRFNHVACTCADGTHDALGGTVQIKAPTYSEKGLEADTCSVCGLTVTEAREISPLIPSKSFTDVQSSAWYYNNAMKMVDLGYFSGVSDSQFGPAISLSRAMVVTVLYKMDSASLTSGSSGFSDVPDGCWYTNSVIWAHTNGITDGYVDNTFRPDDNVTREQLCTMIVKYCQYKGITLQNSFRIFVDDSSISPWAHTQVYLCRGSGIVSGDSFFRFNPNNTATRAEAATMFSSLYNLSQN